MTGLKIRLSRFSGPGARLFDRTAGVDCDFKPAALLLYPHQVPAAAGTAAGRDGALLLIRLTEWDGEAVRLLTAPASVAPLGGDGCVVDLAAGYADEVEIESLRILAEVVARAHRFGLPVIVRVRLNEAVYAGKAAAPFLEIPLAAAEEMGADAVILPQGVASIEQMQYHAGTPLFLAADDGVIVRDER